VTLQPPKGGAPAEEPGGGVVAPRKRRRSPLFRICVRILIGLVIAWIGCAAVVTVLGLRDASHAMQDLQEAKAELSASQLVSEAPEAALGKARTEFSNANSLLDSPLLTPAVVLPVIGRQVTTVRDLARAATQVSGIGLQAMSQLRAVLDAPHESGPARVTALERLSSLASVTNAELANVDPGPSGRLLEPLAKRYDQFVNQVDQIRVRLTTASAVASAVGRILQGPSRYVLLMANNAQMRAGSGTFEEIGLLSFDQGHAKLSNILQTGNLLVPKGAVPVGGDLAARWGWADPSQDWRVLGVDPNFNEIAPVAASMWRAVEHEQVQGVISIDIEALQQLLQVTGPVTIPDGPTESSAGVVQYLMHDEYENLTSSSSDEARVNRLGPLTKVVLDALQDRPLDLKTLATAMSGATGGRHLVLWSNDLAVEHAWNAGGVAGELTNSSLMAAVLNGSGAKLDQYLNVHCTLSIASASDRSEASLEVTLANRTPLGQDSAIAGPAPGFGTVYGQYVGYLAVNLPADASSDFYATGAAGQPVALGAEGPVWLLAVPVDVKAGRDETVVVHFALPGRSGFMTVQPSARIPPETWFFRGKSFTDAAGVTISW
jgi:hypothetical protein